ncbi:MAG: hypothetical protein NVS2B9_14700 [Myxococcales bacterium]
MNAQRLGRLARPRGERLLAWLYTGPLGHLYSALADISIMWAHLLRARIRSSIRRPRAKSGA